MKKSQAPKGKWNFALSPVYLIAILDFEYDQNKDYWKSRQLLRNCTIKDERGITMTDKVNFKFLQLPFFKKKSHQLKTHFDKWCYFLKNLENLNDIPNILNEPIFMKAFDVAKVSTMDKNDYILYQISKSKKYDMELLEEEAERRGMERGMEKGMEKGIEKGIDESETKMVLTARGQGFDAEQIAKFSGIPLERVTEILNHYSINPSDLQIE